MLNKLDADFEYRMNFSPYRNIFRQAGAIREESIHLEKLKGDQNHKPRPTASRLISKLNGELIKSTPEHLKNVAALEHAIFTGFARLERKQLLPYCKKLFKKLAGKWGKVNSKDDLHAFRKRLKQFLYCSQLLDKQEKDQIASSKLYEQLDDLQDVIGKWHDNILLLNKIKEDALKVNSHYLRKLKDETTGLSASAYKKGNKL